MSMVGNDGSVKSRSLKGKLKPRGHDALAQRGRNKNDDDDSVNDRSKEKLKPRRHDAPAQLGLEDRPKDKLKPRKHNAHVQHGYDDDDDDNDDPHNSLLSDKSVKVRHSKRLSRKARVNYRE